MRNLYLGWFVTFNINRFIQFVDSIFEPASFLTLHTGTFSPTPNLFDRFYGDDSTIRDAIGDFAITSSNSLENSVLNPVNSSSGNSTTNLGPIPKSISKGDFPSVPGCLRYLPSISPRYSSQSRSLLLIKTFWTVRFTDPPFFLASRLLLVYELELSSILSIHGQHRL